MQSVIKLYNFIFYISFRRQIDILLIGFDKLNNYDEISRITNNRKHLQNLASSLKREIQGEKYRKPNGVNIRVNGRKTLTDFNIYS